MLCLPVHRQLMFLLKPLRHVLFAFTVSLVNFQVSARLMVTLHFLFIISPLPLRRNQSLIFSHGCDQTRRSSLFTDSSVAVNTCFLYLYPSLHLHFNRLNKSCGMLSLLQAWFFLTTECFHQGRNHKFMCQDGQHKHFTLQACQVLHWDASPADYW